MDDRRERLERLVAAIRRNPVVPLPTYRRLHDLARQLEAPREAERFLGSLGVELREEITWWEGRLLDAVEKVVDRHPGTPFAALVRAVGRDPDFRRLNRQIRWFRAVYLHEEVPEVFVRAHVRDGRRVRAHERLVGCQHLASVDVGGRPEVVARVIVALVARGARGRRSP